MKYKSLNYPYNPDKSLLQGTGSESQHEIHRVGWTQGN